MRSKVLKTADLEQAVAAHSWQARPDEQDTQKKLYQLALPHKHYEKVAQIQAGDVVTITMTADHKKLNRTTKLQVGSGMFDKALEADLVGKQADVDYTLAHDVGPVAYRISDIQRLIVPAVDDQIAAEAGVPGVTTATALKAHYIREGVKEKLQTEAYYFLPTYLSGWEVELDQAELDAMEEAEMERCRGISKSMNMVFDEMTEEQLMGAVGCPSIPEFRKMIQGYFRKTLTATLAELTLAGEDPEKISWQEANKYYGALLERITACALKKVLEE